MVHNSAGKQLWCLRTNSRYFCVQLNPNSERSVSLFIRLFDCFKLLFVLEKRSFFCLHDHKTPSETNGAKFKDRIYLSLYVKTEEEDRHKDVKKKVFIKQKLNFEGCICWLTNVSRI